ncbi:hypothetical protein [Amnibacterium endophyticum]|uniref:Uncharacterized protein n=1 Tax=Amnibacterium endophyticum TaxID=2109337 RepID=A0ABW4LHP6_9MICO
MLIAAASNPTFTVSLTSGLAIAAGVLGFIDASLRFRRPGGNALLAILTLLIALLLLVRVLGPVQPWVSTTLQALWLEVALAVVLVLQLVVRSARKSGVLGLTIVAALAAGAAAVVTYLGVG